MPLLSGDIRFARSANMADVPEGGGPPSAQLLTSGRSNEIFPDISEETRTVGRVEIYQIFGVLRNADRTAFMGANVILAEPPADPNVSVTLLSLKNPFATRAEVAKRIESGMTTGSEWNGYLLEDHFTTMRSIQVLQRPGSAPPALGKTYVLIWSENQTNERRERIRIKTATTEVRTFTQIVNGTLVDFEAQLVQCELFDSLRNDYPGSPPSRFFARATGKTMIRETVYNDAGLFYSAGRLTAPTEVNDAWLQVDDIYTQVVPNSRSEVASVDQRPTSRYSVVLAETPRKVEVGITPHTQRFKIDDVNVGLTYVFQCRPLPAPGTVFIDYWALGQRHTLTDDGAGKLVGQGGGAVSYLTGAINVTLKAVPDIGSAITLSHGESSAYTNRSGQAGYRAPEFAWSTPQAPLKPGSVVVKWTSGGTLRTATDDGQGALTGTAGTGEVNYATGKIYLRPTAMIDPGGEFATDYAYSTTVTQNFTGVAVDAGGFAALTLQDAPAPRSVSIDWVTVRNVSASTGASDFVSESSTEKKPTYKTVQETVYVPAPPPRAPAPPVPQPAASTTLSTLNGTITPLEQCTLTLLTQQTDGNGRFDWEIRRVAGAPLADAFEVTTGELGVSDYRAVFTIYPRPTFAGTISYEVVVTKFGGSQVAAAGPLQVVPYVAPATPAPAPAPAPYASNMLQGLGINANLRAGDSAAMTFTGPVPDGAYLWELHAPNGSQSFLSVVGSFEVKNGQGGFWIRSEPAGPATTFVVEVKNQSGTTLVRLGNANLYMSDAPAGWQPPPPTVIKVRDPLTTGASMTNSGSSPIAGMYAAGVDEAGKTVFVAVPPTGSSEWGSTYNPPQAWDAVWTAADMAAKTKTLTSAEGTPVAYRIWGA